MTETIQIQANGNANSQVTDLVKDELIDWFVRRGLPEANRCLIHHYRDGEFVAISYHPQYVELGNQLSRMGQCVTEMLEGHEKNRKTNDYCVWVHREWIENELF